MKALVVDEDFINRRVLQLILNEYGRCDSADSSRVMLSMVEDALKRKRPYGLIVLNAIKQDDWINLLSEIKKVEKGFSVYGKDGARIMVISPDTDKNTIIKAYRNQCDAFITKPAKKRELKNALLSMGITEKKSHSHMIFGR
jgi:two-component system chemotaxis response regulator CheY